MCRVRWIKAFISAARFSANLPLVCFFPVGCLGDLEIAEHIGQGYVCPSKGHAVLSGLRFMQDWGILTRLAQQFRSGSLLNGHRESPGCTFNRTFRPGFGVARVFAWRKQSLAFQLVLLTATARFRMRTDLGAADVCSYKNTR
jgi:hypothetical protein